MMKIIKTKKDSQLIANKVAPYSILLVEESDFMTSSLKPNLLNNGHRISHYTTNASDLVAKIISHEVQILMMNLNQLGQKELSEIAKVNQLSPLPILVFCKQMTSSQLQASVKATIGKHIDDNTNLDYMDDMMALAFSNYQQCKLSRIEFEKTKTQLSTGKLIENAKKLMMQQKKISEKSADLLLQKMSVDNHQTRLQVAQNIISVCQLLKPKT